MSEKSKPHYRIERRVVKRLIKKLALEPLVIPQPDEFAAWVVSVECLMRFADAIVEHRDRQMWRADFLSLAHHHGMKVEFETKKATQ